MHHGKLLHFPTGQQDPKRDPDDWMKHLEPGYL